MIKIFTCYIMDTSSFLSKSLKLFCCLLLMVALKIPNHAAVITWVAPTGGNWTTPSNWSGGVVPGSADDVIFDATSSVNCFIDISVTVQSINISGYTGTISDDGLNNQFICNSTFSISSGTFNGLDLSLIRIIGAFNQTGGTFNCNGPASGGSTNFRGNFTSSAGTFNHSNGTVLLNLSMTINNTPTFYNLTASAGGSIRTYTIANSITVLNTITVSSSTGSVTFSGGIINYPGNNISHSGITNFNSVMNYNSSSISQTIPVPAGLTYSTVQTNNTTTSGVILGGAITSTNLTGDLFVMSGKFSNGGYSIGGNPTKTLQVNSSSSIILAGTSSFPTGFGTVTLQDGSTVEYSGTTQTVDARTYSNLTIGGSGSKTMGGSVIVNSTAKFNGGAVIIGANTLTLNGPINFSGGGALSGSTTSNLSIGATPGGTITGNLSLTGDLNLAGFTIDRSGQSVILNNDLTIATGLNIANGNLTLNGKSLTLNGSLSVAGTITGGSADKIVVGGSAGTISIPTVTLNQLQINRTSGTSLSGNITLSGASALVTVAASCTLSAGTNQINGTGQCTISGVLQTTNLNGLTGSTLTTLSTGVDPVFLSGTSTVDFNAASGTQIISARSDYATLIFSGGGVKSLAGNIASSPSFTGINFTLNNGVTMAGGSNTVSFGNTGGTFTINGVFQTSNANGFAGGTNTAILNTNAPTINLGSTSTIEYNAAGAQSITVASPASYQNLTLSGSGTKTPLGILDVNGNLVISGSAALDASTFNINLAGNWTNNATFTANTATVVLDGTLNQTIGGTVNTIFNNLTLNNTGGATLSTATTVAGILSLRAGTLASGTNMLTMDLNTGLIAWNSGDAGSISGTLITQKTINQTKYHHISSPLSGATIDDLHDDNPIVSATGFKRLYSYNEATGAWVGKTTADLAEAIDNMKGYAYTFPSTISIDIDGSYDHSNTTRSYSLSFSNLGWNLIGNPYPSPLNWDAAAGWTKTNTGGEMFVWDNATNKYYGYLDASVGGSINTDGIANPNIIPSMQGFWVKATAAGPFSMDNGVRVTTPNLSIRRIEAEDITGALSIKLTNGSSTDETKLRFGPSPSIGYDKFDMGRLGISIGGLSLYSVINSNMYAINSLPENVSYLEVPLKVMVPATGQYSFNFSELGAINSALSLTLKDKLLNTTQEVLSNKSYSFNMDKGDTTSRFYIVVSSSITNNDSKESGSSISLFGGSRHIRGILNNIKSSEASIVIFDILGKEVSSYPNLNISANSFTFANGIKPGVYIVRIQTGAETYSSKVQVFE